jgi:Ni,Fe-hydrogenase III small subunit/NAD-dependent dihydropyrimidine dehydrogenase PreA subunit
MLKLLKNRIIQGHRTSRYPDVSPVLPERFRGRPLLGSCESSLDCNDCREACPTDAIQLTPLRIDLGACLFCGACEQSCSNGSIQFSRNHQLASRNRNDLVISGEHAAKYATALGSEMRRLFGRSLKLRQVSAGGCNGCEADLNVLSTVGFDLGRFGIQFVASPRHADGIVITGPVSRNMEYALRETYAAVPAPKLVIAVGACAISGGPYAGANHVLGGVPADIPVDLYIPGCPPHPYTTLDGLLRLLGRLPKIGR